MFQNAPVGHFFSQETLNVLVCYVEIFFDPCKIFRVWGNVAGAMLQHVVQLTWPHVASERAPHGPPPLHFSSQTCLKLQIAISRPFLIEFGGDFL